MREAQVPSLILELRFHMLLQEAPRQKNQKAKMRYRLGFRCKKPGSRPSKPGTSPPNALPSPPHEAGVMLEKAEGRGICAHVHPAVGHAQDMR